MEDMVHLNLEYQKNSNQCEQMNETNELCKQIDEFSER